MHGGLQLPAVHHAAVLGAAVHVALPVHQLHRQGGDAQQLHIAGVGLDQAAAQAPFQRSRRHQAVNDGHIPQKLLDQGDMEAVKHRVPPQQHHRNGRQGQPPEDPGVPALVGDDPKGQQDADHDPPHHQTKKPAVLVVFVPGLLQPEHLPVQVVGQHQQHRKNIADKRRPQGMCQPFFPLCPVQNLCQIQQCHRQGQLKEVIAIPAQPAQSAFRQQLVFEQAQQQPSHHQPAHHNDDPADIPTDHPVRDRSLPQQDRDDNQQGG